MLLSRNPFVVTTRASQPDPRFVAAALVNQWLSEKRDQRARATSSSDSWTGVSHWWPDQLISLLGDLARRREV